MLAVLEQLLILQDRDRKITYLNAELAGLGPQRRAIQTRADRAKVESEGARHRVMELETNRKKLELDVETKKQQIDRYSLQQYQTKKNEEYRALAHEIETAKKAIQGIEDQELEIMEQMEGAQKAAALAALAAREAKAEADQQTQLLAAREENLRIELSRLETERAELATAIEESALNRYERLRRTKGDKVVVGIEHGVCGGCHMRLPAQVLVTCQAQQELATCINCGRLLYYTRDMSLAAAE